MLFYLVHLNIPILLTSTAKTYRIHTWLPSLVLVYIRETSNILLCRLRRTGDLEGNLLIVYVSEYTHHGLLKKDTNGGKKRTCTKCAEELKLKKAEAVKKWH